MAHAAVSPHKQPLQPMKVLEPAVASSMSGGVNTKPLRPVQAPVAPTSRKKHCTACHQRLPSGSFSSSQLRNRATARRCQTCLQQQGILSKDEEATCREINQVFATEHRGDVATGAAVDIMLPSAQSATKHLNAPRPSTTPTWSVVRQARWRWSHPKPSVLPTCEAPQRHASHSFVGRRGGFAARLRAAGMPVPTRLERRSCSHRSCSGDEVSRSGVHWFVPRGRASKTRARRPSA